MNELICFFKFIILIYIYITCGGKRSKINIFFIGFMNITTIVALFAGEKDSIRRELLMQRFGEIVNNINEECNNLD